MASGDEDALVGLAAGERPDERLDRRAPDDVVGGVALGLDVDAGQAERVLADDPVDAAVTGQPRARRGAVGAAVPIA